MPRSNSELSSEKLQRKLDAVQANGQSQAPNSAAIKEQLKEILEVINYFKEEQDTRDA